MSITHADHSFKNSALEGLNYPNKACVWHDMMSMLQLMLAPISMISKNITILPLLRYFPNSLHSKKILNRAVKLARCATLNSSLKKFSLEMKILNATQIDFSPFSNIFASVIQIQIFRFSDCPIGKVTDWLSTSSLLRKEFWITIKSFWNVFRQSGNLNFQAFTRWLENQIRGWNILTLKL